MEGASSTPQLTPESGSSHQLKNPTLKEQCLFGNLYPVHFRENETVEDIQIKLEPPDFANISPRILVAKVAALAVIETPYMVNFEGKTNY